MNSTIITLDQLPINQQGMILKLNCNLSIKKRLLDLGLIPGTYITSIFTSPFGEPTAFEFRNTIISIRNDDTSHILVRTNMKNL